MSILDGSSDDIQHQGEPTQAEGGDQERVQSGELLDQDKIGPVKISTDHNSLWVSVRNHENEQQCEAVGDGPPDCGHQSVLCCSFSFTQVGDCHPAEENTFKELMTAFFFLLCLARKSNT